MADDELDAVADELVGDRNALLRIGHVVALLEGDLLAEDAAGLVDVVDRLLRPMVSCAPNAAFGPVIGPATPILIWALAAPAAARAAANTAPDNQNFFMQLLPSCSGR